MIPIQLQIFLYFITNRTPERLLTIQAGCSINSYSLLNNIDSSQLNNGYNNSCNSRLRSSITKALAHFTQLAGSIVPIGELFIDIKPNFPDTPMNANKELTKVYEKYKGLRRPRNKPKQTQPNPFAL